MTQANLFSDWITMPTSQTIKDDWLSTPLMTTQWQVTTPSMRISNVAFENVVLRGAVTVRNDNLTQMNFIGWVMGVKYPTEKDKFLMSYDLTLIDWKGMTDRRAFEGFGLHRMSYHCKGNPLYTNPRYRFAFNPCCPLNTVTCGDCSGRTALCDAPSPSVKAPETLFWWDHFQSQFVRDAAGAGTPLAPLSVPATSTIVQPELFQTLATQHPCCATSGSATFLRGGVAQSCLGFTCRDDRALNGITPFIWERSVLLNVSVLSAQACPSRPGYLMYNGFGRGTCTVPADKTANGWRGNYTYMFAVLYSAARIRLWLSSGMWPNRPASLPSISNDELSQGEIFNYEPNQGAGYAAFPEGRVGVYTFAQKQVEFQNLYTVELKAWKSSLPACSNDLFVLSMPDPSNPGFGFEQQVFQPWVGILANDFDPALNPIMIAIRDASSGLTYVLNATSSFLDVLHTVQPSVTLYTSRGGEVTVYYTGEVRYRPPPCDYNGADAAGYRCQHGFDSVKYFLYSNVPTPKGSPAPLVQSSECWFSFVYPPMVPQSIIPLRQMFNATQLAGCASRCPPNRLMVASLTLVDDEGVEGCFATWSHSYSRRFAVEGNGVVVASSYQLTTVSRNITFHWVGVRADIVNASGVTVTLEEFIPVYAAMPECYYAGTCKCNLTWPNSYPVAGNTPPPDFQTAVECTCPMYRSGDLCELCDPNPFDNGPTWGANCQHCANPIGPNCSDCHAPPDVVARAPIMPTAPPLVRAGMLAVETCWNRGWCNNTRLPQDISRPLWWNDPKSWDPKRGGSVTPNPGSCRCKLERVAGVAVYYDGHFPSMCEYVITQTPTGVNTRTRAHTRTHSRTRPTHLRTPSHTAAHTRTRTRKHTATPKYPNRTHTHVHSKTPRLTPTWTLTVTRPHTRTHTRPRTATRHPTHTHTPTFTLTGTPTFTVVGECTEKTARWDPDSLVSFYTKDSTAWSDGSKFSNVLRSGLLAFMGLYPQSFLLVDLQKTIHDGQPASRVTLAFCGGLNAYPWARDPQQLAQDFVATARIRCVTGSGACMSDALQILDVSRIDAQQAALVRDASASPGNSQANDASTPLLVLGAVLGGMLLIGCLLGLAFLVFVKLAGRGKGGDKNERRKAKSGYEQLDHADPFLDMDPLAATQPPPPVSGPLLGGSNGIVGYTGMAPPPPPPPPPL